jgi:hypothetical protein
VLRFDFSAFEEICADATATTSAVAVVFGASVLAGFGSWLWAVQSRDLVGLDRTEVFIKSLVLGSIIQTAVWFLWVYIVDQVLVRAYGARANFLELTRTMGFAFAPVGISVLIAIAGFAVPFGLLAFGLTVLLTNAAVQNASDADPREAALATVAGFVAFLTVMGIFANVSEVGTFGGLAPGVLFFTLDF